MFLRNVRWLSASLVAVAALLAAPARSQAAFEILIQEIDSGGNVVTTSGGNLAAGLFNSTVSGFSTPSFNNITVAVVSSAGPSQSINSITTPVGAQASANFDPTHALRITVTDLGFNNSNPNGSAVATSTAGVSIGLANGSTTLDNQTFVLTQPFTGPPTSAQGPLGPTSGQTLAQTGIATDTRPSNQVSAPSSSSAFTLPGSFAIQQVITLRATAPGGAESGGQTLGGTASSVVQSNPVPAPAGLLLGLLALPALALRRAARRTPA